MSAAPASALKQAQTLAKAPLFSGLTESELGFLAPRTVVSCAYRPVAGTGENETEIFGGSATASHWRRSAAGAPAGRKGPRSAGRLLPLRGCAGVENRRSKIVILAPMADSQDRRCFAVLNFERHHIARCTKRDDQFAKQRGIWRRLSTRKG